MIKRIIAACVLTLSLCSCAAGDSSAEKTEVTPPFWKVIDENTGGTVYLLGTMHAVKQDITYPDYIMEAFDSCDTVAFELDYEDTDDMTQGIKHLLYDDGMTAKQCLGEDYAETVEFMKSKGLYSSYLDSYIPYYWASVFSSDIIEECGISAEQGSDMYFFDLAKKDGKKKVPLESYSFQYEMMSDIPMELQLLTLSDCIGEENYKGQIAEMNKLYAAWSSFDEEYFGKLELFDEIPEGLETQCSEMQVLMYDSRQRVMADKAAEYLQKGEDLFLFVGAAHFYVGEDILTLLEEKGYTPVAVKEENKAAA